jgi:hypothetical protein
LGQPNTFLDVARRGQTYNVSQTHLKKHKELVRLCVTTMGLQLFDGTDPKPIDSMRYDELQVWHVDCNRVHGWWQRATTSEPTLRRAGGGRGEQSCC